MYFDLKRNVLLWEGFPKAKIMPPGEK